MFSRRNFVKAVLAGISGVGLFKDATTQETTGTIDGCVSNAGVEARSSWIGGVCSGGRLYMCNPATNKIEVVAHLKEWKIK